MMHSLASVSCFHRLFSRAVPLNCPSRPVEGEVSDGAGGLKEIRSPEWKANPLSEAVLDGEIAAFYDHPREKAEGVDVLGVGDGLTGLSTGGDSSIEGRGDLISAYWTPDRSGITPSLTEINGSSSSMPGRMDISPFLDVEMERQRVEALLKSQMSSSSTIRSSENHEEHPILIHKLKKRFPNDEKVSFQHGGALHCLVKFVTEWGMLVIYT